MLEHLKFRFLLTLVAGILAGTSNCWAGLAGIQDDGGFFSAQAKSEASRIIAEMRRSVKKDLAIETFKAVPDDIKQGVNLQDKAATNHMFELWAAKQAELKAVNGVYILLVKEPPHIEVAVGNDTQKLAFTLKDRDTLVTTMRAKLHQKQFDEALLDGVNYVSATMRSHVVQRVHANLAPNHQGWDTSGQSQSSWGWVIPVLLGLLAVWVIAGIIRSMFGGGAAAGGGGGVGGMGMPASGGGGGFLRSMLGGMFGAAAGMWMYDQFTGRGGSSSWGGDQGNRDSGDTGFSGQDTDYSASGDSFSDDSGGGGGDSGGGDSGGGDSGGGDSGGGGDF